MCSFIDLNKNAVLHLYVDSLLLMNWMPINMSFYATVTRRRRYIVVSLLLHLSVCMSFHTSLGPSKHLFLSP
jgi:hypothetical protein